MSLQNDGYRPRQSLPTQGRLCFFHSSPGSVFAHLKKLSIMTPKQSAASTLTLSAQKRLHFAKLTVEAKMLEKEINRLVASFEKRNKLTCYTVPNKRNAIELVISTDINTL